jgi:hypothetical protein
VLPLPPWLADRRAPLQLPLTCGTHRYRAVPNLLTKMGGCHPYPATAHARASRCCWRSARVLVPL